MVFSGFASPSALARREILGYAAKEAAQFGTTVRGVVDTFFAGKPRPGLLAFLERMQAVSGLPPAETMALVSRYWDPEEIEPADLLVVLEQLVATNALPTPEQARELVEASQRLSRRSRTHARLVKAAQAAHDAEVALTSTDPPPLPPPTQHAVRARSVQRYSGLRAR